MNQTTFLVDGFNLYHSVVSLQNDKSISSKWLDIKRLCQSHLYLIGKDAKLTDIFYFSALAYHLAQNDPDKIQRHRKYIACLEEIGLHIQLAKFKKKFYFCDQCNARNKRHEEKETDVAIASKIFELFYNDDCDTIVLVTGDTDLRPAVITAKQLFPDKAIIFAFPYKRKNNELSQIAPGSFKLSPTSYSHCVLPDPFVLKNGQTIYKPKDW